MSKVEKGNTVSVHYRGTLDDGTEFDSSYDRNETLTFQVGSGQMIPGFDAATVGMQIGEVKNITLKPDEAYGPHNDEAVQIVSKEMFPNDFEFTTGVTVQGTNHAGAPLVAQLLTEQEDTVTLDFNHPMAGKDLNFKIELVEITE